MPKGVPKNQKLVDEILYRLCKLELREKESRDSQDQRIAALEEKDAATLSSLEELYKRIRSLEARIAEMNEAFSHARFPRAPQQLETMNG